MHLVSTVRIDTAESAQTRAEAAEKELAHVKEKAWKIMEEKDAQLKAARVSASQNAAPSLTDHLCLH